ncbi:MAG: extracellular solute-binding protein [Solobacterium sp.]|nr:extracellular solute-binding protein [Solobacterium sp.]MBQ6355729.1 extracellular solute-binding protein [Solobacterium sp.]MBQ6532475.1 extracellular solute-binding protein [Solobacterium sp.]
MNAKKLMAGVLCAALLAGCSGSGSGSNDKPSGGDEKVSVTVTVWGPQEDQSDDNGKWLQTQCENFAKEHEEWDITFNYGVCSEGDAKTNLSTDPAAGADVYMFANDQIPDLLKAGAIAELGGKTLDAVKAANSATTVNTVTYDGSVYGVPFTANTWFMYYDKSVFTDEDAKSLDAMLAKGKVAFPLNNSWYLAAFYVANGCTLFGPDGGDAAAGIDFSGDKAVAVTNYLVDLVANPNFVNGDVSTGNDIDAFFSGTWDYQKAVDAYGDNLGIAAAPSYTLDGELKQMKSFAGSKAIGVNPTTTLYKEHPEIAVALAAYLGSTAAQQAHYDQRNIIPTDMAINVGDDALAKAQMDTMDFASIVQPLQADMGNYWTPAQSMGDELVAGNVTHDNAAEKTEAMNESMNSSGVN